MNGIKEVLAEKGIKPTWLSEKFGKSFLLINGYAQNRRRPSLEVIFQIPRLLDVKVNDLINDNIN